MTMKVWPRFTTAGSEAVTVWPRFLIDSALILFPSDSAQAFGVVVPARFVDGVTIRASDRALLACGDRATLIEVSRLFHERAALLSLRGAGRVQSQAAARATAAGTAEVVT